MPAGGPCRERLRRYTAVTSIECGVPVSKRFAAPDNGNGVFWYSFDQSLVHTTVISGEHNLTKGSPQHNWLKKDLSSVNRTITPAVINATISAPTSILI